MEKCRVLELGCASGGNLIPMAYMLPGSEFLGIDSSQAEIADGQAKLAELALPNVTLRQANILDVTPAWGQFDYIIAHGIYSWVPPEVQAKILAICPRIWRLRASAISATTRYRAGTCCTSSAT